MNKNHKLAITALSLLSLVSLLFVACNDQDEFEDIYLGLDVDNNTPLTRSTSEQYEGNSSNNSWADVPKKENECMLYAMIKMAVDNHNTMGIKRTYTNDDGEEKTRIYKIGEGYSAKLAYDYAFSVATKYKQPQIDENNQVVSGSEPKNYSGGAMTVSVGLQVGKEIGLLKGHRKVFDTYNEMVEYIKSDEWRSENPGTGRYLINDNTEGHTVIYKGLNKKK